MAETQRSICGVSGDPVGLSSLRTASSGTNIYYYHPTTGQWSSELTDCFDDVGICLCGTFVPCCLACRVASDYGECCCLPIIGGGLLALRTGLRERHRIPGTICNDCVCLTFCGPCALCQLARELKERK